MTDTLSDNAVTLIEKVDLKVAEAIVNYMITNVHREGLVVYSTPVWGSYSLYGKIVYDVQLDCTTRIRGIELQNWQSAAEALVWYISQID